MSETVPNSPHWILGRRDKPPLQPAIVANRSKTRALRGIGLLIHQSFASASQFRTISTLGRATMCWIACWTFWRILRGPVSGADGGSHRQPERKDDGKRRPAGLRRWQERSTGASGIPNIPCLDRPALKHDAAWNGDLRAAFVHCAGTLRRKISRSHPPLSGPGCSNFRGTAPASRIGTGL